MKIGIALSGGGIRGIAHAGVLQALEDNNIKIDIIGGTSAGSMVASLYSIGYKPQEIHELFKSNAKKIIKANHIPFISSLLQLPFGKKFSLSGFRNGEAIEEVYNNLANRRNINSIDNSF